MGYTVDYQPTYARNTRPRRYRRMPVTSKPIRKTDMVNAVRWHLPQLEHDTVSTSSISCATVIRILRLDQIAKTTDPSGKHVLRQLIAEGWVDKPSKHGTILGFDREPLLAGLKRYAGVA